MPEKLPFKEIAERVDIFAVAQHLSLNVVKNRAQCPACGGSDRALELLPETNTFRCWKAPPREPHHKCLSGDCIALYAHVNKMPGQYPAAQDLMKLFPYWGNVDRSPQGNTSATPPQKPEAAKPPASPAAASAPKKEPKPFDRKKFAASLNYDERVKAMELSEEKAEEYRIGTKRGKLFLPICPPDVEPAGWAEVDAEGNVNLPDSWLQPTNVVKFPKTA